MTTADDQVMHKVRRALGRSGQAGEAPAPPALPESLIRLVPRDADLAEVFVKSAKEQKMLITRTSLPQIAEQIVSFMKQYPIRRIALAASQRIERLGVESTLKQAGFDVQRWDRMTLDELYEFDCAVTDVDCAVAENATLVIKPSAEHGRGLSLVPMYHVAIVEASQILPDMIDLFERLDRQRERGNVILITGPSKTADIEMNVVTGVHGPNVVQIMLI